MRSASGRCPRVVSAQRVCSPQWSRSEHLWCVAQALVHAESERQASNQMITLCSILISVMNGRPKGAFVANMPQRENISYVFFDIK